jgi:hypothetical protein
MINKDEGSDSKLISFFFNAPQQQFDSSLNYKDLHFKFKARLADTVGNVPGYWRFFRCRDGGGMELRLKGSGSVPNRMLDPDFPSWKVFF